MACIEVVHVTPEDFVATNLRFLSDSEYDVVETELKTRKQIKRVSGSDLRRGIDEFPLDEPLVSQCAHWMHAFAGKHFFPDANHRTALVTLKVTLRQNGFEAGSWSTRDVEETVETSKLVRWRFDVDMGNLYEKDELYEVWLDYFDRTL